MSGLSGRTLLRRWQHHVYVQSGLLLQDRGGLSHTQQVFDCMSGEYYTENNGDMSGEPPVFFRTARGPSP